MDPAYASALDQNPGTVSDPDVCLLASQYSLIDHANALNNVFPVARQRGVNFVVCGKRNYWQRTVRECTEGAER
jgi:hypothetical protein